MTWAELLAAPDLMRATLTPLWCEQGLSAGQIAALIPGASRNSVIGQIHRKKIGHHAMRASPPKSKPAYVPKRKINRRAVRVKPSTTPVVYDKTPEMDHLNNLRPPLPGIKPISLLELPNRIGVKCRFPVIGGYCGLDTGDDMYCPTHHGFMYAKKAEAGI